MIKKQLSRNKGFAMMEVLMTILVLAIGALGLANLQLSAMKYNKTASSRSQAVFLADELADRMRANMAGVQAGSYTMNNGYTAAVTALSALTTPACGTTTDCTSAQLATLDLVTWNTGLKANLPSGTGAVIPVSGSTFTYNIVIMWQDKILAASSTNTDSTCPGTTPVVGVRCLTVPYMP
jgi:type IV pilus assembly protein PilV